MLAPSDPVYIQQLQTTRRDKFEGRNLLCRIYSTNMYRPLSRLVLSSRIRQLPDTHKAWTWSLSSAISRYYTVKVDYESKYAEKLHQVAAE